MSSRTVPLTNSDKVAIISAEDYERVSQYCWFLKHNGKGGYYPARTVRLGKKFATIWLHRFIMQPTDGQDVHHRNGNRLNCRRDNLECIRHSAHAAMYYGPETKAADEYAEQNCTEQEWENR